MVAGFYTWACILTDAALSTIPAGLYLLFERVVLRGNTAIMGARSAKSRPPNWSRQYADQAGSVWVFVLLAVEAIKTYKANPYFRYGSPTRDVFTAKLTTSW